MKENISLGTRALLNAATNNKKYPKGSPQRKQIAKQAKALGRKAIVSNSIKKWGSGILKPFQYHPVAPKRLTRSRGKGMSKKEQYDFQRGEGKYAGRMTHRLD